MVFWASRNLRNSVHLRWLIGGSCWTFDCSCIGYGLRLLYTMRHGAGRLVRCKANTGKDEKTRAPARNLRRASSQRRPASIDDLYTARAANRQPVPASCGGMAHKKLDGVDGLYTARAAIRQPAQAGRGVVAHRKLAGVDVLHTARAANQIGRAHV